MKLSTLEIKYASLFEKLPFEVCYYFPQIFVIFLSSTNKICSLIKDWSVSFPNRVILCRYDNKSWCYGPWDLVTEKILNMKNMRHSNNFSYISDILWDRLTNLDTDLKQTFSSFLGMLFYHHIPCTSLVMSSFNWWRKKLKIWKNWGTCRSSSISLASC